tara:strand:- start:1882 stop:2019 length:138 start_codon:yes stop_codon:yes gene_type:complete
MTEKEKIIECINKVDDMILLDFMTVPVKEGLQKIKTWLEEVRDNL